MLTLALPSAGPAYAVQTTPVPLNFSETEAAFTRVSAAVVPRTGEVAVRLGVSCVTPPTIPRSEQNKMKTTWIAPSCRRHPILVASIYTDSKE
jgi:hypothetical protein